MNKCIMDIFKKVGTDLPGITDLESDIAAGIEPLIEAFKENTEPEQYAKIESAIWHASYIAESKGFELGMKYLAKLLAECLS